MLGLVVIGQQIKEKRKGGTMCLPAHIITKYPSLNRVNGNCFSLTIGGGEFLRNRLLYNTEIEMISFLPLGSMPV